MMRNVATVGVVCFLVAAIVLAAGCTHIRPPAGVTPVERLLITTGYCKCGECCEWRRNWYGRAVYASGPLKGKPKQVGVTASGTKGKKGTIAADTSRYPFGTVMYVPGYGYGVVEDRGGAIKGDHIDLYHQSHWQALKWGCRRVQVKIWLPRKK